MKVVVGRVADFAPGQRRIVEIGRRSIGVFRVGDRFYALNNHCPHQGGPLCLGRTAPWVTAAAPGQFEMAEDEALVACPWHGWEYELSSGQSFLGPGQPPVRGYAVSVEPGETAKHGRLPGPYVAETFEVHTEDEYVVVDTASRPAPVAPEHPEREVGAP